MLLICEPVCCGHQHVPVNSGLLKIITAAFPSRPITFCAEKTHLALVRGQFAVESGNAITWRELDIPYRHADFFHRIAPDFRLAANIFEAASSASCSDIIFTTSRPSTLWAVRILLDSRYRQLRVQIVLHGELNGINGWRSRNPYFRLQDIRTALTVGNSKRIKYIVLEETIRELVAQKLPELKARIACIDHPLPPDNDAFTPVSLSLPLQFGFLGLATKQKGFFKFLEVAKTIGSKYPEKIRFHLIGRIHPDYRDLKLPELKFLAAGAGSAPLERREFIRRLAQLHYACLFYQIPYYEYSASGVLLDCIALEKPVVATPTRTIQKIAEKYGEIGYICDITDMVATIEKIVQSRDSQRYLLQVEGMRRVKQSRNRTSLAIKFRNLMNS